MEYKEKEAFDLLENYERLHNVKCEMITHDDILLLRAQKSDLGMTDNYRGNLDIKLDRGRAVIVNYVKSIGSEVETLTEGQWEDLPDYEKDYYKPQYLRVKKINDIAKIECKNNQFDLVLNLYKTLDSRYREVLISIYRAVMLDIISYIPQKEIFTEKNIKEAVRHRIKDYLRPTEYEYNILFKGEIGTMIYKEMQKIEGGKIVKYDNTIYLKGYNRYKGQVSKVKYYKITTREGGSVGEKYKLEITFLKEFFKKNGIGVNQLLTQPKIQDKIRDNISGEIRGFLTILGEEVISKMAAIYNIVGTKRQKINDIAINLTKPEMTLTKRVSIVEEKIKKMERDIEQIKDKIGL